MKSLSLVVPLLLLLLLLLPLLIVAELRKTPAATTADPKNPLPNSLEPKNAVHADAAQEQAVPGGYQLIKNISDPYIQGLGKFAVVEHNKQAKTHLHFQRVYNGSYQIVAGTNYKLLLWATDGLLRRNYGALVFKDLQKNLHLKDFYGILRN